LIPIDKNHSGICKFEDQHRGAYEHFRARVTKMVEDGIAKRKSQGLAMNVAMVDPIKELTDGNEVDVSNWLTTYSAPQ
jgi:hypothetical protein